MLNELFQRIGRRKQEWRQNIHSGARGHIIGIARKELGLDPDIEINDIYLDHAASTFEAEGLTEADVRATVDAIKQRFQWFQFAAKLDKLKTASEVAEKAARLHDEQEGLRRKAALATQVSLDEAARVAQLQFEDAIAARSNLLAGAMTSPAERELNTELAALNNQIVTLKNALDPNGPAAHSGALYGNINTTPALLLRQTREELANTRVGYTAERRAEQARRLAAAEQAVAERTRELAEVQKQRAAVITRLQALNAAKLLPESFEFVRASPSLDDRMKQHGRRVGFTPESGITVSVG